MPGPDFPPCAQCGHPDYPGHEQFMHRVAAPGMPAVCVCCGEIDMGLRTRHTEKCVHKKPDDVVERAWVEWRARWDQARANGEWRDPTLRDVREQSETPERRIIPFSGRDPAPAKLVDFCIQTFIPDPSLPTKDDKMVDAFAQHTIISEGQHGQHGHLDGSFIVHAATDHGGMLAERELSEVDAVLAVTNLKRRTPLPRTKNVLVPSAGIAGLLAVGHVREEIKIANRMLISPCDWADVPGHTFLGDL